MADPDLYRMFGCVVCFHDAHPDGDCNTIDEYTTEMTGREEPCGCREQVSYEERLARVVTVEGVS